MKNFIYSALTFPKRHTTLCCMIGGRESLSQVCFLWLLIKIWVLAYFNTSCF